MQQVGSDIQFLPVKLQNDVAMNDYFDMEVSFIAPQESGHYSVGLYLQHAGERFGEQVFCDFKVEDLTYCGLQDQQVMQRVEMPKKAPRQPRPILLVPELAPVQ